MNAVEITIPVGHLNLKAKRWGNPKGKKVIAIHGWLDNCTSFDVLAPLLKDLDLVCIDSLGHGLSDFRPHLGAYNVWQDTHDVFAVADFLSWDEFSLIGHSRGSMVAFLCAGAIPDRILNLICIEGLLPRVAEEEAAPELLKQSIETVAAAGKRPRHHYPSFDAAVLARVRGVVTVCEDDARTFANRSVLEEQEGFYWRYDYKLMMQSEIRLSQNQINAFRDRIKCPVNLILANQGLLVGQTEFMDWLDAFPACNVDILPGHHHLHMSENAVGVAALVNQVFA